jgi:hypothetical protein
MRGKDTMPAIPVYDSITDLDAAAQAAFQQGDPAASRALSEQSLAKH